MPGTFSFICSKNQISSLIYIVKVNSIILTKVLESQETASSPSLPDVTSGLLKPWQTQIRQARAWGSYPVMAWVTLCRQSQDSWLRPSYFSTDMRPRGQTTNSKVIKCTRISCCALYDLGHKHALLPLQPALVNQHPTSSQFLIQSIESISPTTNVSNAYHTPGTVLSMHLKHLTMPQGSYYYRYFTKKKMETQES